MRQKKEETRFGVNFVRSAIKHQLNRTRSEQQSVFGNQQEEKSSRRRLLARGDSKRRESLDLVEEDVCKECYEFAIGSLRRLEAQYQKMSRVF